MCGIVGYVGQREALPLLLDSLKRLEYRGYDSAGVAVLENGGVVIQKNKGFIADLEGILRASPAVTGLAHTRWATHGKPSRENAHPFLDCSGKLALAHNGIIENYQELRERLKAEGHTFTSETDTESMVHLLEKHYQGDLRDAMRHALKEVHGTYAFVAVHKDEPHVVVAARNESPLVVGLGTDENFIASDVPALLKHTQRVLYLMDGEVVHLTPERVDVEDAEGHVVTREPPRITWNVEDAEKGGSSVAISNVLGSSITREVDATLYTRAGIEIGVAATKTFIAQVTLLTLLAIHLGRESGALSPEAAHRLKEGLRSVPQPRARG